MRSNSWWKIAAAILAVLLLSAPSAVGVYKALAPTRGPWAAGGAALGFELAYLAVSLLTLRPELRRHARAVALGAVGTAIVLNTLADYAHRVAGGLSSGGEALRLFDGLALGLAVVESAPLAGLAYALATLLHRIAEAPEGEEHAPPEPVAPALAYARELPPQPLYPAPVAVEGAPPPMRADARQESIAPHLSCPRCGAELDRPRYLAARRWGHCASCKG